MYKIIKTSEISEVRQTLVFSVGNENRVFCDISDNEETAQRFVDLLNENDVKEEHVLDMVEDFFYS